MLGLRGARDVDGAGKARAYSYRECLIGVLATEKRGVRKVGGARAGRANLHEECVEVTTAEGGLKGVRRGKSGRRIRGEAREISVPRGIHGNSGNAHLR